MRAPGSVRLEKQRRRCHWQKGQDLASPAVLGYTCLSGCGNASESPTGSGIDRSALRSRQATSTMLRWSSRTGEAVNDRMAVNIAQLEPTNVHQHADY